MKKVVKNTHSGSIAINLIMFFLSFSTLAVFFFVAHEVTKVQKRNPASKVLKRNVVQPVKLRVNVD